MKYLHNGDGSWQNLTDPPIFRTLAYYNLTTGSRVQSFSEPCGYFSFPNIIDLHVRQRLVAKQRGGRRQANLPF